MPWRIAVISGTNKLTGLGPKVSVNKTVPQPSCVVYFRSEMCVPTVHQPHLWDVCRRSLLEFCDVDWWEGRDSKVLPVTFRDEGPGLLLQLPKCLQEDLLFHRLLQQRDAAPISRYIQNCAFQSSHCFPQFIIVLVCYFACSVEKNCMTRERDLWIIAVVLETDCIK